MTDKKEVTSLRLPVPWTEFINKWCEEHGEIPSKYKQDAIYEKMLEDGYVPEK